MRMCALCVLTAFVLAACATTGGDGPATAAAVADAVKAPAGAAAKFYPLAVGNSWTYKGRLLGQPAQNRVTVTKKEGAVFFDDKGGQMMNDADGLRDRKRYLLKDPLRRGASWMSVASVSSVERFEIIDTGRSVKVEAGVFDGCIVVRGKNRIDPSKEFVTEWTYAPGVGLVRIQTFLLKEGKEYVPQGQFELSAFELKIDPK